jgi:hypothetical protein
MRITSFTGKPFRLTLGKHQLIIQEHNLDGYPVYHVVFPDATPSLTIYKTKESDSAVAWDSIPEGRSSEAQEIGILIDNKIKNKIKKQ